MQLGLPWWNAASLIQSDIQFYIDNFTPYIAKKIRNADCEKEKLKNELLHEKSEELKKTRENGGDENVAPDWLKLYESGLRTDLTIYCREEEAVQAHFLVIFARCQTMLEDVIEENNDKKVLSVPEVSKNVMKSFLR